MEKPWLDDPDLKQLVEEEEGLYSRKLRWQLAEEGESRWRSGGR